MFDESNKDDSLKAYELYKLGNEYYAKGKFDLAIEKYTQAIKLNKDYDKAYYNRGLAYACLDDYDKAIEDIKHVIEINPSFTDAYYILGLAYEYKNMFDNAIDAYNKTLQLNPSHNDAKTRLSLVKSKKNSSTQSDLFSFVRKDYNETTTESLERTLLDLQSLPDSVENDSKIAKILTALFRPQEALVYWNKVLTKKPDDKNAAKESFTLYFELGKWEELISTYDRFLSNYKENSQQITQMLICALLNLGKHDDANKLLKKISDSEPTFLTTIGRIQFLSGKRAEALKTFEKAMLESPDKTRVRTLFEIASGSWLDQSKALDNLVGLEYVKEELRKTVVFPLLFPEAYMVSELKRKSIFLLGPPGCGKTSAAKAAAEEAKAHLFELRISDILRKWLGDQEQNLKAFFARAKKVAQYSPVVIFIDEIDSFASDRMFATEDHERRLVNQLLTELDGISYNNQIAVIASTNLPISLLDSAIIRPGRVGYPIYVGPPNTESRKKLLERYLASIPHEKIDFDLAVKKLEWFSSDDIRGICSKLFYNSKSEFILNRKYIVTNEILHQAIDKTNSSVIPWFYNIMKLLENGKTKWTDFDTELQKDLKAFFGDKISKFTDDIKIRTNENKHRNPQRYEIIYL